MELTRHGPEFRNIKKILLIKLKHIGDVLLTTPCIRTLHETFSNAKISFLVNEGTEAMLQYHPLLEEVLRFPRSSMRHLSFGARAIAEFRFANEIRKRKFDMIVDLTSADRAAWLGWWSGAHYRVAYDPQGKGFLGKRMFYTHLALPPNNPDEHEVQKNLGLLKAFEMSPRDPRMELHLADADVAKADEVLNGFGLKSEKEITLGQRNFIIFHPTSRWLFKCWENSRCAALIDWIQAKLKIPVLITCGPDLREQARAHEILALTRTQPRSLIGQLTLTQWAAVAAQARLFIGVDSAPMHIAASQGTPSLAFFGPTGFQNWRPWAVEHTVLVHDCPCSRDRKSHCDWTRTRACMAAITLEEAQHAVAQLLHLEIAA